MARPNPVRRVMQQPLPNLKYQRAKLFRPTDDEIEYAYSILNRYVFDDCLKKPNIIQRRLKKTWGYCQWFDAPMNKTWCEIHLHDRWFCAQWFMNTLAHEMAHQYQWDVYRWQHQDYYGREMPVGSSAHGPSFFMWSERFTHFGLTLKTAYGQRRWFQYQDFTRC